MGIFSLWRMVRDSNPRMGCPINGFQDRRIRPLCQPSETFSKHSLYFADIKVKLFLKNVLAFFKKTLNPAENSVKKKLKYRLVLSHFYDII